jgi:hypothetical protein
MLSGLVWSVSCAARVTIAGNSWTVFVLVGTPLMPRHLPLHSSLPSSNHETAMAKCPELSINEMLSDPIVRAMMASDRVNLGELQHLLRSIAEHLRVRAR